MILYPERQFESIGVDHPYIHIVKDGFSPSNS